MGQAAAFQAAGHAAAAQDPEGPWRTQVLDALNAAGAKDYPKAEQAFLRAVQESAHFGSDDPRLGTTLNSLGLVYRAEKKYSEAEGAYRRALSIMEDAYGSSIDTANLNFNIANVMFDQGHQAEALPNLQRTAAIYERLLGDDSMKTADVRCMEGDAYRLTKRYPESETALRKCADAREVNGGLITNGPLADALHSLALTLIQEGKFSAAEPRLKIAEQIRERTLGITSPILAQTMEDHISVLRELGRYKDAERLTTMAAAIRRQSRSK
ncbi:MAG TPA: tetratricopeptide repeat protein [Bryobacteraceae bacterium]|nr:tetratricopeptide repeat protein [Bryobacteraceae bacterium]